MAGSEQERAAIEAVVQAYIDGSRTGDAEHAARRLPSRCADVREPRRSAARRPDREFFKIASGQPADVDGTYEARIVSVEQVGDAATATMEETGFWGTLSFTDYFSLSRFEDGGRSSTRPSPTRRASRRHRRSKSGPRPAAGCRWPAPKPSAHRRAHAHVA